MSGDSHSKTFCSPRRRNEAHVHVSNALYLLKAMLVQLPRSSAKQVTCNIHVINVEFMANAALFFPSGLHVTLHC